MLRFGYLGPKGTYTEKAAQKYCEGQECQLEPFKSIPEIFWAVRDGVIEAGVVPIENSIEGSVNQTLDFLVQEKHVEIQGEVVLQVEHVLMAPKGVFIEDIGKVISHSQALAQCSRFLEEVIPRAEAVEAVSTARAAAQVSESNEPVATIGHPEMADIYGLNILREGIANCESNMTRFIVIGLGGGMPQKPTKTSILISITDRPGGLYQILKEFALRSINLTKIESRPAKNALGNYLFFIDFIGHPGEDLVTECLDHVREITAYFRILGSYKGAEQLDAGGYNEAHLSLEQLREDIDIIDRQIVELLAKRTELVKIVGEIKGPQQQIRDKNREAQILAKLTAEAENKGVSATLIKRLYGMLFEHFVDLQETKRKKKLTGILQRKLKTKKRTNRL